MWRLRRRRRQRQQRRQRQPGAAAAALPLLNDAHLLPGKWPKQPRTDRGAQAVGQKSPLALRERQLTGVKVRRRRRRRRHRRRHRRHRRLRRRRRREEESKPNERARKEGRKESFCAFFAGSIRSLSGRGRLEAGPGIMERALWDRSKRITEIGTG